MYDHYIAVDWAQRNMAIARMTRKSKKVSVIDVPSDIGELRSYLLRLRGSRILTIEETTTSQWLYTELKSAVDKLVMCDPYRNRLLSEGPKTDKIDAIKLVRLLKADLLKPVFHSGDKFITMRKMVSGYEALVKSGVRSKNQRSAICRAQGKPLNTKDVGDEMDRFVLEGLEKRIESYEVEKERYEKEFGRLSKKHRAIRLLRSVPGIGSINAVKIVARIVDPRRFPTKNHFLSYCGLIKLEKISGGKSYGKRRPRCCRSLKGVFKTAAMATIGEAKRNPLREYYEYLLKEKNYPEHNARNAVARRIAILSLGILKGNRKFQPYPRRAVCRNAN